MVGNACKYSQRARADGSDSGITVTVQCVVVGGRKMVEFSVQDASLHRFSPIELKALYSRPVTFRREAVGGMGTGMCCLAARVKALGGDCGARLRADNLPGTVVWFRVPCEEAVGGSQRSAASEPGRTQAGSRPLVSGSVVYLAGKFDSVSKLIRRGSSLQGMGNGGSGRSGRVMIVERVERVKRVERVERVEEEGDGCDGWVERGQTQSKDQGQDQGQD